MYRLPAWHFSLVATIAVGALPHGIWPSGEGTRAFVSLEDADLTVAIDTASNTVISTTPIGQAAQAVVYVPNAVPTGAGATGLTPLDVAGRAAHFVLAAPGVASAPTTVALFDQGLVQVVQASVSGLRPMSSYVLALAETPDGSGDVQPLSAFMTNPAGAAIVDATGPIRQLVQPSSAAPRRYLAIASGTAAAVGAIVQVQAPGD